MQATTVLSSSAVTGDWPITVQVLSKLGKLSRSLGDPVRIPRVLQPDFVFRGYKVHVVWFLVKDRQVQHTGGVTL